MTPTSWFSQNAFPLSTAITTSNTGGNTGAQMPLNVPAPAGYKLAQDSLTGQILLLPSGTKSYFQTQGDTFAFGSTNTCCWLLFIFVISGILSMKFTLKH